MLSAIMRIGALWTPCANAEYRAVEPLKAMKRRGHEVVWPNAEGKVNLNELLRCDVVHIYRCADDTARGIASALSRAGVPITFDNDDDHSAVPKESPSFKATGGLVGQRRFAMSVKLASQARCFTTTSEVLAEKYRNAGVERIEVIGNYLSPDLPRPTNRHDGVVVGWVAAHEHLADAARIPIAEALERVVATHSDAKVVCVGVDLKLPERYSHAGIVPFHELPQRLGDFDVGIAPLADIPMNRARSDVKLKEYAASGVPWLASPVGPYVGLGEEQGGRLVADDAWFEELSRLVSRGRERRRLARKARKWGKRQTIDAVADRWESVFVDAARQRG